MKITSNWVSEPSVLLNHTYTQATKSKLHEGTLWASRLIALFLFFFMPQCTPCFKPFPFLTAPLEALKYRHREENK